MCYLIAKRFKKSGCIALKAKRGKELADFTTNLQKKLGYDIQIVAITRPTAYGEYEPYHFVNSLDVSQLHVFTYSERPNTQALKISHIVTSQEKHERCRKMLEISEQKLQEFYEKQQGKLRPVLFEHPKKGMPMHGFTDNYIRVEVPYDKNLVNKRCSVVLGDFNEAKDALKAEQILE